MKLVFIALLLIFTLITAVQSSTTDIQFHKGKQLNVTYKGKPLIVEESVCSAFRANAQEFTNLTIKKIPPHVLNRCEWGHDDYSLQGENLPQAPPKILTNNVKSHPKKIDTDTAELDLFGAEVEK